MTLGRSLLSQLLGDYYYQAFSPHLHLHLLLHLRLNLTQTSNLPVVVPVVVVLVEEVERLNSKSSRPKAGEQVFEVVDDGDFALLPLHFELEQRGRGQIWEWKEAHG